MKLLRRIVFTLFLLSSLSACSGFFFYPSDEIILTPEQLSLSYEDTWFESEDGTLLHAWFLPAQGLAKGSVLFLHGNAQNISNHLASVYWLPERGFNVFMLDYRGYGKSEGSPSVSGLREDALAAFRTLRARPDVDPEKILLFGQSLGGVFAADLASREEVRNEVRYVIIDSAFTRFRDIAGEKLEQFWLTAALRWPLIHTITDKGAAIDAVDKISPTPLLFLHGLADQVVPAEHSERLFAAAASPAELWLVPSAKHIQALARQRYRDRLIERIEEVLEKRRRVE